MHQWIINFAANQGDLLYPLILLWTFFEGETVVLVTGALISGGLIQIPAWSLILCAFIGSAAGDQTWYYVGRKYGNPILERKPRLRENMHSILNILSRKKRLFILTFRFIYGLRSVSPFVIGFAGISPKTFVPLNLVAALIWATLFTAGGSFFGFLFEKYMGWTSVVVIGVVVGVPLGLWFLSRRRKASGTLGPSSDIVDNAVPDPELPKL